MIDRTVKSASIRIDLLLVKSCCSLHLPRGATFLGVRLAGDARDEVSMGDITEPKCSTALAEQVEGCLTHC